MRWGYASTAAIVRSLQKDLFYRNQLKNELNIILLDNLRISWYWKVKEWIPLLIDIYYYSIFTGMGRTTLGQAYTKIIPVDTNSHSLLLNDRLKRILLVIAKVVIPFMMKKLMKLSEEDSGLMESFNSILLYYSGKFPSFLERFLSIRFIYYPRKPPIVETDSVFYNVLAIGVASITINKLIQIIRTRCLLNESTPKTISNSIKPSLKFKCPICLDPIREAFASSKCGHVYCWHCISKWFSEQQQQQEQCCPICRVPCNNTHIIPLLNLK